MSTILNEIRDNSEELMSLMSKAIVANASNNKDQVDFYLNTALNIGKQNVEIIDGFLTEFTAIKSSTENISDDVVLYLLMQKNDEIGEHQSPLEKRIYEEGCKTKYKDIWDKLESDTKQLLITSHYIRAIMKSRPVDFSPVVLEMCRAFENELRKKIFDDYISKAKQKYLDKSSSSRGKDYLFDAIESERNKGRYFISIASMMIIFGEMRTTPETGTYKEDFYNTLSFEHWDTQKLSDQSFCVQGKEYTIEYRNESAHPNIMGEDVVNNCEKATQDLLCYFVTSKE